jgi:hypothetical protein
MGLLVGITVIASAVLIGAAASSAAVITRHATTASYKLTLEVGPTETMYTQAQLKSMHPTGGEVMLGNSAMMAGMSSSMKGGTTRRLEVRVFSRSTGKVVTHLKPTISLTDLNAKMAMAANVAVVEMEGIGPGGGAADYHYGNNVMLTPRHVYDVVVTIDGQRGRFSFTAS